MTPATLLHPILTYCADLPGFSRHAIEVAETEHRIGSMLWTLHHWERSAVEWRERAEGLHARVAELERERDQLALSLSTTKAERDHAVRSAELLDDELHNSESARRDFEHAWLEGRAIMAVCGYFSRMRGPDFYAYQFTTCVRFSADTYNGSGPLHAIPLYAGSAPVPAEAKVADGWVLVPREPTEEMVIAALKEVDPLRELIDWTDGHGFMREDARRAWSAMLAAKAKGGGE